MINKNRWNFLNTCGNRSRKLLLQVTERGCATDLFRNQFWSHYIKDGFDQLAGLGGCEPLERRCVQPRPSILHLAKSLMTLPIRSCLRNLFGRARNKVLPHQDLLWTGRPANQQYATSISTLELNARAICPEIVKIHRVN